MAQFVFKKRLPLAGIRMLLGKRHAERCQSVQHLELPLVLPIKGFHAQHAQHISNGYAVASLSALEFISIFLRKRHARLYTGGLQKT